MGELIHLNTRTEPWISKNVLASYLSCSKRWVEQRTSEGMPSRLLAGKRAYRVSEVEDWLRETGHLQEGA